MSLLKIGTCDHWGIFGIVTTFLLLIAGSRATDIFYEWDVSISTTMTDIRDGQPVITINGMFPGPLINVTTDDMVHVNVFNNLDEPILMTWNGIQQRLNSWQDGVSGTNCPIQPGKNWTYVFQTKDQIGTFFYFPSINYQKAAGGYGPIRINNPKVDLVPYAKPEDEFDLLIGDWSDWDYKSLRSFLGENIDFQTSYIGFLMNGKVVGDSTYITFNITKGKTYLFRISNVGSSMSINFRIQNHTMMLVEAEGTYTQQTTMDTLDVHVGQSYSVLIKADQPIADYYIEAYPSQIDYDVWGVSLLRYATSTIPAHKPFSPGPGRMDRNFSMGQAELFKSDTTAGASRPNPPGGTFDLKNVTLSQFFILHGSKAQINGAPRYTVNNVAYVTPDIPLKLVNYFHNISGVYQLDEFPVNSSNSVAVDATNVVTGIYKGWIEIVFKNDLDVMDSWHLDGFAFYVLGFGDGEWSLASRRNYNLLNPLVRSTVQVYPGGWTAVYAYLDNPGMWNLRSQILEHWYFGEELYIWVDNKDDNSTKETKPPANLLICGLDVKATPPASPAPLSSWCSTNTPSSYMFASIFVLMALMFKF